MGTGELFSILPNRVLHRRCSCFQAGPLTPTSAPAASPKTAGPITAKVLTGIYRKCVVDYYGDAIAADKREAIQALCDQLAKMVTQLEPEAAKIK